MSKKNLKLIGSSPEYLRMLHGIRMVAATDARVMISGEPGTGKVSVAEEIHAGSRSKRDSLLSVKCSGITDEAFASRLAAVTEAMAKGGARGSRAATLLLDEVADLSAAAQAKLLNRIESWERSAESGMAGIRLLTTSSKDLHTLVSNGAFREDLFYRLYIVPIEVPPLRARGGDLALLLKHYTAELARAYGHTKPRYSVTARNLLYRYCWPGNLRELHNFCERMVVLMSGKIIQPEHLPLEIRRGGEQTNTHFLLPSEGVDLLVLEGSMIRQALVMAGGNRSKAARLLGLSRDTLLYRIRKHAIEV